MNFCNHYATPGLGKLPVQLPRLPVHPRLQTPIAYYGGKQRILKYILPLIPEHTIYCEPFFGGGALFFAKKPAHLEVINDINGEAVNFYRVVQKNFTALEKEIKATLHSRLTYYEALEIYRNPKKHSGTKRAWAFWTLTSQGFSHIIGSWGYDNTNATTKSLASKRENFTRIYAERLRTVQVEHNDALKVMLRCDSPDTFHYCDPPYYNADMAHYDGYTAADFENLLKTLPKLKGKFVLSCYPSALLATYLKKYRWQSTGIRKKVAVNYLTHKTKTEMLVYNFKTKHHTMGNAIENNHTATRLIRNYINFHKKEVNRQAIENYVAGIEKAIKEKQLTKNAPGYSEIETILKRMQSTLGKTKSERIIIEINKEGLNHYLKIITGKQKTQNHTVEIPETMSIGDLAKLPYKTLPFTGMWKEIFGDPTKPFKMLIHGDSHRGKTTLLLKLVSYLASNFGKVMYVSSEEYPAPTLIKKVREIIHPYPKTLDCCGSLNAFKAKDYDFIVVDSVNHAGLTIAAFKKLCKENPDTCFILIFQETQEGRIRGGKDWEFEMDIAADLYDYGKIRVFKNRCSGVYSNYNFMEEAPVTIDPDLKKAKIHLNGNR